MMSCELKEVKLDVQGMKSPQNPSVILDYCQYNVTRKMAENAYPTTVNQYGKSYRILSISMGARILGGTAKCPSISRNCFGDEENPRLGRISRFASVKRKRSMNAMKLEASLV